MAEVNWNMAAFDPQMGLRQGNDYVNRIYDSAAKLDAGRKYAAGDRAGAARTLAERGDIGSAQAIEAGDLKNRAVQQGQAEAAYEYIGRALPVFEAVAKKHASDPDGGAGALASAFDQLAPEIAAVTGHPAEALQQFRQSLVTDAPGTLQRVRGMLPVKYQTVGRDIVRQQGNEVTPVYQGERDAPAGYRRDAQGNLQFEPNGPADPEVIRRNAETRREIIINNPIPVRGGAASGVKAPSGFRWAADGETLEPIPGGPADKLTEGQAASVGYGSRLSDADKIISELEGVGTALGQNLAARGGVLGNYLLTPEYQKFDQAQRNFINAQLRRESGAVISDQEFDNARKQYLPQPGDSKDVIAQKRANRLRAISSMKAAAGRGAKDIGDGSQTDKPDPLGLRR